MRLRSKAYRHSQQIVKHLPGPVKAAHSLIWLQLLATRDLNDLTMHSYAAPSGSGFDSEAHNVGGLFDWEQAAFDQALAGRRRIMVAGAGGGREMIALGRMGFEVTGFDASDDLADACRIHLRKAGIEAEMLTAPPGGAPKSDTHFDALVIGRGVYHHIPGRANRIAFLRDCASLLFDGAPLIMGDVLTRQGRIQIHLAARLTAFEPGDSVSDSFYHFFTTEELVEEIAEAGFAGIDCRTTPVPGRSRLAHVVARKSGE